MIMEGMKRCRPLSKVYGASFTTPHTLKASDMNQLFEFFLVTVFHLEIRMRITISKLSLQLVRDPRKNVPIFACNLGLLGQHTKGDVDYYSKAIPITRIWDHLRSSTTKRVVAI